MSARKIKSVLYVDDDPDICEVVQATLCLMAGLEVHTAGSGEQAIDLACELRPDLILMDVMMPGLDGPSTLKRLRGHSLLWGMPVIFLTAKVLPAEVARFRQLGALGVIGKPFDPLKLCDDVLALWKQAGMDRENADSGAGSTQAQAQIGALTDSFLERTGSDVIRLRTIIERARRQDRSVLDDAHRLAHSIHGAGAMFGFPEVSAVGGAIEQLIENAMADSAASRSVLELDELQQLLHLTDNLAREVEAGRQAAPGNSGMLTCGAADRTGSS